jgi:hypothetical protein
VLAYKLLTGRAPFVGRNAYDLLLAARTDPPRPMRQFAPELMPSVERMVLRALGKTPQDRYRDTNALEAAILEVDAAGRRRASGRTGTVVPGSLGATNEQPMISQAEIGATQPGEAMPPLAPHLERAHTPWDNAAASGTTRSQIRRPRSASIATPLFVSVTIGALAGAAFLVYARFGDTGSRAAVEAPAQEDRGGNATRPDASVQAELSDRIRRRCADMATDRAALQVQLSIGATGTIDRVRLAPPHDNSELRRCVEAIVQDAEFATGEERELSLEVAL